MEDKIRIHIASLRKAFALPFSFTLFDDDFLGQHSYMPIVSGEKPYACLYSKENPDITRVINETKRQHNPISAVSECLTILSLTGKQQMDFLFEYIENALDSVDMRLT